MLEALNQVAPGVYSRHTLLYGVEVKFYSSRVKLNENLEERIKEFEKPERKKVKDSFPFMD